MSSTTDQPSSASTPPPPTSWRNQGAKDRHASTHAQTVEPPATAAAAVFRGPAPTTAPVLHPTTTDGRIRHYYTNVDGAWLCACGDTRPIGGNAA